MILHLPDDYEDFRCAGRSCPKNCCIGWELELDEETASYYKTVSGPLGKKLKKAVSEAEILEIGNERVYILKTDGPCRFLTQDGLCEIVTELSEEALCEICAEYPRYTVSFGPYVEKSLTLSCPEAARLFLKRKAPLMFAEYETGEEEDPQTEPEKEEILSIRTEALELLYGAEALSPYFPDRSFSTLPFPDRHRLFLSEYAGIRDAGDPVKEIPELVAENLLIYCVYRYFPRAETKEEIRIWARFAERALSDVRELYTQNSKGPDALRNALSAWSKTVEHSEERIGEICGEIREELR